MNRQGDGISFFYFFQLTLVCALPFSTSTALYYIQNGLDAASALSLTQVLGVLCRSTQTCAVARYVRSLAEQ